ncbi:MAG: GumC family protein [Terriglobia bacterium]
MDELERRQGTLSSEALSRLGSQALDAQPILDVSPEEVPHLLDYWAIVRKRRWVVLACLVVVFTTVAIGTLKERPLYEGKVLVEIDPEAPAVVNFKEVVSNPVDMDTYMETQYKILKSRSLAERVVRDLQLYRLPEFYKSRGLFGLIQSNPKALPSSSDPNPDINADYYRNSVSHMQDAIDISPVRRSNLVEVSFESYSPETAERVANELAQDYIKQNFDVKWQTTTDASNWLSGKLVDLQAELEKSEKALQAYAQSHGILYITDQQSHEQSLTSARMQELLDEYSKAQGDMFAKEGLYSLVQKGKVEDLPGVLNNGLIQGLEEKMADLKARYDELTARVKPNYPTARELQKEINGLQTQVNKQKMAVIQNIVDNYNSAEHNVKYLAKAIDDQKAEMNAMQRKSVQYNILKRKVDSDSELYQGMLQRMKEAQVSAGLNASNIRIVDAAIVPKGPVKPRVPLNLALGLILGLCLGVGLAFFQEYLDKTLKTSDDVERLLRLPSLGILPKFALNGHGLQDGLKSEESEGKLIPLGANGNGHHAPAIQTAPDAAEAFRSLRTSILLSASPVPKLLLITSALPSEGKTTTALNLGATLASLNTNVVVVDCDMRRPAVHRSAGVENKPGFVQCLTGHVKLEDAVLPVPGVPNLSVIPCGPIPPNPAEILSSHVTGELLRKLREMFEFVLVDSPPILSVADSRILATLTDAAILVTRAHSTPYDVVRRARSLLYGANSRILGVALNDVDLHRDGYYGYSGGNFGYGYGYGHATASSSGEQESADKML